MKYLATTGYLLLCAMCITAVGAPAHAEASASFAVLDRNADGELSSSEYAASGMPPQQFAAHDADNTKTLNATEFTALVNTVKRTQRQGGPHPPRG